MKSNKKMKNIILRVYPYLNKGWQREKFATIHVLLDHKRLLLIFDTDCILLKGKRQYLEQIFRDLIELKRILELITASQILQITSIAKNLSTRL